MNLKKVLFLFWGQFCNSLTNIRVILGYLIGIVVSLKMAYSYCGYAGDRVIQIFEPYIQNMSGITNITLMLIGFIVIISDAPYVNDRTFLIIYRANRGQWFWGMSLYIMIHCTFYYIMSLGATCVYSIRKGYIDNIWSRSMRNLAISPSQEATNKWHLPGADSALISDYQPISCLFHTILLIWLYSMILAMIIYILNTTYNKAVGSFVAAAVHMIGYIMAFDGFSSRLGQWSLFYNSIFMSHFNNGLVLISSYLLLILVLCILFFVGPTLIRRADFKYSSGEENE